MPKTEQKLNLKNIKIAVVGATGTVGKSILSILDERGVKATNIYALSSNRSRHQNVSYGEKDQLTIQSVDTFDFSKVHVAFFAIDSQFAAKYIPTAVSQGALVIDKSSFYRLDPTVPLLIPEVNPESLNLAEESRIISNPNCSTIQLVTALKPIHDINPIKRIITSTYQAVSGAGSIAMEILFKETKDSFMDMKNDDVSIFKKPIAFNIIPQIDEFTDSGDTKEELKLRFETQKILASTIQVAATCVRVPVFIGHSMSVNIELTNPVNLKSINSALKASKALSVTTQQDTYDTPIEVAHEDAIYVSRIRIDESIENGLAMWIVADNTRKGAALNGIQILEYVLKHKPSLIYR